MTVEEDILADHLKLIIKGQAMQHVDLSDCGLTEGILLTIGKAICISNSLLAVHLSGNPGLKDHTMRRLQAQLNATYETPLLPKTFKPLIKMEINRNGGKNMAGKGIESPRKDPR